MNEREIYHEKQSRMLCAVHCLNNLFQSESNSINKKIKLSNFIDF